MPAGGLFSTAADCGLFCQMLLNGGEFGGKRYLSEKAVKELTHKQTPETLKDAYGLGFATGGGGFGHGGAFATNMTVDPEEGPRVRFHGPARGFPRQWQDQPGGLPQSGGGTVWGPPRSRLGR